MTAHAPVSPGSLRGDLADEAIQHYIKNSNERKTSYEMSRGIGEKYWKNFEQPNQARSVWQNCPLMQ
jgi:hypothetical protein